MPWRNSPRSRTTKPAASAIVFAHACKLGLEGIVSKLYQQLWNGQHGASDNIQTQSMSMSFESHSQLGNFGMGTRAAIPRSLIDNSIGNTVNVGNFRDFDFMSRNARSATNAIAAIDKFKANGASVIGDEEIGAGPVRSSDSGSSPAANCR